LWRRAQVVEKPEIRDGRGFMVWLDVKGGE
jgi:hypothetical protein